jgi:hypothetical protein
VKRHSSKTSVEASVSDHQIHSFRLNRGLLLAAKDVDPVTISRDVCGVQAQIMSAAYLQLWTRNHSISRTQIEDALWKKRTLVKTSLMRQTLHLIPADEFWLYISALKPSRLAGPLRIMARFGITRTEADDLTVLIMDALSSGPLGRAEIAAAVRPKVSKRVRAWMEKVWSIVRLPVAEGWICYGSGEGNEVKLIRTNQWLKTKTRPMPAAKAQHALLRKYLRAYGPATLQDFSHWSGIPISEVRPLRAQLGEEFIEIDAGGRKSLLHEDDLALLDKKSPAGQALRLLPHFDPYLLAHREKEHLLSRAHYKRVYRNQGWISPVLLIDGGIAGVWSYRIQGRRLLVTIEPFARLAAGARSRISLEAQALGAFLALPAEVAFA